jgi:hypothetical protein
MSGSLLHRYFHLPINGLAQSDKLCIRTTLIPTMARRSPLEQPALRTPGQSLDEQRFEMGLDAILVPALVAIYLTVFWLFDLWRSYRDTPPTPWLTGTFAAAAVAFAVWKIRRTLPVIRRLRLAREGERAVGQGLEDLRKAGYAVYHDILGDGFNVDHVVVGAAGLFTIETKTWGKPPGDARITVDGDSILVAGLQPLRDPIPQARAQAAWIASALKKSTARDFPVFPVVVFPGWWVEVKTKPKRHWVINDKMLSAFLAKEPIRLTIDEQAMAKSHLEAFIRSREAWS